jgi:hypothetical protein
MEESDIEPLLEAVNALGSQLGLVAIAIFVLALAFAGLGCVFWRGLSRIEGHLAESMRFVDLDRAEELLLRDELTQLEELAQREIRTTPNNVEAHWYLALSFYHRDRMAEAKFEFQQVVRLNPSWRDAVYPYLEEIEQVLPTREFEVSH